MFSLRSAILASTIAVVLGTASLAHADETERRAPSALSPADRLSYTTAFDALRRGDLDAAREAARQARDRVLLGQVEFERLFHADYTATYEELAAKNADFKTVYESWQRFLADSNLWFRVAENTLDNYRYSMSAQPR